MQAFHIYYGNTQGTLMRILTAVSRRGIDMPYVHALAVGGRHRADLLLEVNGKQSGQLCRDWHAIVDVSEIRTGVPSPEMIEHGEELAARPSSAPDARSAMAGTA
ncbi:MAG: hypothetical protein JO159_16555 [Acidobacteria bacterium]|nr:hypothetical protein [Acidobacteriota bacterium]MBV9625919.1 hypothetical protein [Acidobacteriota bacterium]